MGVPENRFKRGLKARGQPPLGSWLMSASPIVAEAMGWAGFDFVVVDMEHSPLDLMAAVHMMQAVAGTGAEAVVRVPWRDPVTVKRVLDAGARTIMFPMIQTAEEARAAVAATRYPPRGIRGVASTHRGSRFGTVEGYLAGADAEIAVIVQLETPEAVAAREAIAAVDGVDALFLGPADLSAAMGQIGNARAPEVQATLTETAGWCRDRGVACGIVGPDASTVKEYEAAGFSYVAIGSDLGLMMAAARLVVGDLRGAHEAPAAESAY